MRKHRSADSAALHVAVDDPARSRLFARRALLGLALLCLTTLLLVYPGRTLPPLLAGSRDDRLVIDYLRHDPALRTGDPGLRLLLAERYLHVGAPRQALRLLRGLQGERVDALRLRAWEQQWQMAAGAGPQRQAERAHVRGNILALLDHQRPRDYAQWRRSMQWLQRLDAVASAPRLVVAIGALPPLAPEQARQAARLLVGTGHYELAARLLFACARRQADPMLRARLVQGGAQALLASGQPVRAYRATAAAVAAQPDNPTLDWLVARLALGAGRTDAAARWLQRAVDLDLPPAALSGRLDAERRELAWQVLLGAGRLAAAQRVAAAALVARPDSRVWARRRARVLEWNGHPDAALRQWARLLGAGYDPQALAQLHRLALALHARPALDLYWRERAAHTRMATADWLQYAQSLEDDGHPRQAAAVLRRAARAHPGVLPALGWLLGNMGQTRRSLAVYAQARQRGALDLRASIDYATALDQQGRFQQAFEELWATRGLRGRASLRAAHQKLLGDLAWDLGQQAAAAQAYTSLWRSPALRDGIEPYQIQRLVLLRQHSAGAQAALRLARAAWRRHPDPDLALLWLRLLRHQPSAAGLQDWQRAVDASAVGAMLWRRPGTYALRASVWQALGRPRRALADEMHALRLRPGDSSAQIDLLWMCLDANDRACLRARLPAYAPGLRTVPGGPQVLSAAAQALGDYRRALAWAALDLGRHRSDALWLIHYGDLLAQAGEERRARAAYDRAWSLLQAAPPATRGGSRRGVDELVARLRLARSRVGATAQRRVLQALRDRLLRGQLDPRQRAEADAAIGDWLLGLDTSSAARRWLARAVLSPAARQSLQLQIDLRQGDSQAVATDLRHGAGRDLMPSDRAQAWRVAGQPMRSLADAEALLDRAAARGQDSAALRALQRQTAERELARADSASLQLQDVQLGAVVRHGPAAQLDWHVAPSWSLQAAVARQALGSNDPGQIRGVPGLWKNAVLGLRWQGARSSLRAALTGNRALGSLAGWQIGARTELPWGLHAGLQVEHHAVADESAALLVAGSRDRLRLRLRRDFGRAWASLQLAGASYQARDGQSLGTGRSVDAELGWWLHVGQPDLSLKLLGYDHRFQASAGVNLQRYAGLVPGGGAPGAGFFVPASDSALGVGIGFDSSQADRPVARWMPYGELDLLRSRSLGLVSNAVIGISGPLLGADAWMFGYSRQQDVSGLSRQWILQYRHWFGR